MTISTGTPLLANTDLLTVSFVDRYTRYGAGVEFYLGSESTAITSVGWSNSKGNYSTADSLAKISRSMSYGVFGVYYDDDRSFSIIPTKEDTYLQFLSYEAGIATGVVSDGANFTTSVDPTGGVYLTGTALVSFDIDFSQGTGVLDLTLRRYYNSNSVGERQYQILSTATAEDMDTLDAILCDSSVMSSYVTVFRLGNKLYVKSNGVNIIKTTSNSVFLTNMEVVVSAGQAIDEYETLGNYTSIPYRASEVTNKFTFIPSTFASTVGGVLLIESDGTQHELEFSTVITRADLGTSAAEQPMADFPTKIVGVENTKEGVIFTLDKEYSVSSIFSSGYDQENGTGLLYLGDAMSLILGSIPKPENEVEAQSSENEIIYYTPIENTIGFDLYNEVEGVGETAEVKTYLGTTQEIKDSLVVDGYTLVETYEPNIGIEVPDGNELVIYNLVDVIATTDPTTFQEYWKELHVYDLVNITTTFDASTIPDLPEPEPEEPDEEVQLELGDTTEKGTGGIAILISHIIPVAKIVRFDGWYEVVDTLVGYEDTDAYKALRKAYQQTNTGTVYLVNYQEESGYVESIEDLLSYTQTIEYICPVGFDMQQVEAISDEVELYANTDIDLTCVFVTDDYAGSSGYLKRMRETGYKNTIGIYHHDHETFANVATTAASLSTSKGKGTWKFLRPVGVSESKRTNLIRLTEEQKINLIDNLGLNLYDSQRKKTFLVEGQTMGGYFVDEVQTVHMVNDRVEVALIKYLRDNKGKVKTKDSLPSVVEGVLKRFVGKGMLQGYSPCIINSDDYNQPQRLLNSLSYTMILPSGIHFVYDNGVLTYDN